MVNYIFRLKLLKQYIRFQNKTYKLIFICLSILYYLYGIYIDKIDNNLIYLPSPKRLDAYCLNLF